MAFTGIPAEGFQFLMEIRFNNNREWFNANRERYIKYLRDPLYAMAAELAPTARAIDPAIDGRPARIVARIYRDARRTRGEDFYRDHLWMSFKPTDKALSTAFSFWFFLSPEEIGWGIGFYEQRTAQMNDFRARIDAQPALFRSIAEAPGLKPFGFGGDDYTKPKKEGLDPAIARWYNKKSFYLEYTEPVSQAAYSPELLDRVRQAILDTGRLYQFVNGLEVPV